jgi:magnesium chelatase family protein
MLSKVISCGLLGIDGYIINVETDISNGIPSFEIVGLGDTAVKEAKERVRAAIRNSGLEFPIKRITVNLAPADLKKEGSSLDLPIAMGILSAEAYVLYHL